MNWNDLSAFLALYQEGSYASAARALGVSATTVARRVERLADDVGAVLFQSTNDGLVATAAAESMLPSVLAVQRQTMLIERRMSGEEARLSGVVRVATAPEFLTYFLLDHIDELHRDYPGIELDFLIGHQYANLSRGEADIAIRFAQGPTMPVGRGESADGIVGRFLGPTDVCVVASKSYIAKYGRPDFDVGLSGHRLALQTDAYFFPGMEYLAAFEDQATVAFRCDSITALLRAAAQGFGLTVVPTYFVRHYDQLVILKQNVDQRTGWLLMPRDLRRVARIRVVRDFLAELYIRYGGVWAGDETAEPPQTRARS